MKNFMAHVAGAILLLFAISGAIFADDTGDTLWSFSYFGAEEEDYFYLPSDIEIDQKNELIYVVDSGNHRVVVFDFQGRLVRTMGREGQGPGELSQPSGACVGRDSVLAVADYRNNRIQIYDRSGKFIRNINTREVRVADVLLADDLFYTVPSFGTSGFNISLGNEAETQPLVVVLDKEGEVVREITINDFPETQPFIRALKNRVSLSLSPDQKLYLVFSAMNLIQVFDLQGSPVSRFERELPYKPIMPTLMRQTSGTVGDSKVVQMMANMDMVSQAAHFGPDGNLYILANSVSTSKWREKFKEPEDVLPAPTHIDVIDPKNQKLFRRFESDPGTRTFGVLAENRIVYIHEDESGELVLKCLQY
jgi:DNA-binding beta-propeller fold protein YncE